MYHADGTVHFSDLKQLAKSPAHYLHAVMFPRVATRPMRIGTLVDFALIGDASPIIFDGDRRGKAWETFRDSFPAGTEIYTRAEAVDAHQIIASARLDPQAREYLGLDDPTRRTQVPLSWTVNGVPRSTRGVDVLIGNRLVDLKVTNCTEPGRFGWHARKMMWHAQLADYEEACRQNNIDVSGGLYLVGIESTAPHCVTVLRMTPAALEEGRRCVASWIETFKSCAESNQWPGYVQSPVDLDVDAPSFGEAEELDEEAA